MFTVGVMSVKNQGKVKRIAPSILSLIHCLITMQCKDPKENVFLDRFLTAPSRLLRQLRLDYYISLFNDSAITADISPDENVNENHRKVALDVADIVLTQHKPDEFVDYNADLEIVDGLSTITVDQLFNSSEIAIARWREYINRNSHVKANMENRKVELEEKKKAKDKLRAIELRPKSM